MQKWDNTESLRTVAKYDRIIERSLLSTSIHLVDHFGPQALDHHTEDDDDDGDDDDDDENAHDRSET